MKGIVEQSPNETRHVKAIHCQRGKDVFSDKDATTKAHYTDRVIDPGHLYK